MARYTSIWTCSDCGKVDESSFSVISNPPSAVHETINYGTGVPCDRHGDCTYYCCDGTTHVHRCGTCDTKFRMANHIPMANYGD